MLNPDPKKYTIVVRRGKSYLFKTEDLKSIKRWRKRRRSNRNDAEGSPERLFAPDKGSAPITMLNLFLEDSE